MMQGASFLLAGFIFLAADLCSSQHFLDTFFEKLFMLFDV